MTSILKEVIGTFDGENMIAEDGETFSVPANYASKSKLIEGDTLKALVHGDGSIIYKQIKTVTRTRFIGTVVSGMKVQHEGKKYNVLGAVIRYYQLRPGMQLACISTPKSNWCAVESVIATKPEDVEYTS